jgi:hypothetical protein
VQLIKMFIAHKTSKRIAVANNHTKLKIRQIWWHIVCHHILICRFIIKLRLKITIAMDHKDLLIFPNEDSWWQIVLISNSIIREMEVIRKCRINKIVQDSKVDTFNQILVIGFQRSKLVSASLFYLIYHFFDRKHKSENSYFIW